MPSGELQWIRHALSVARQAGCTQVALEHNGIAFEATLEPRKAKRAAPSATAAIETAPADDVKAITSPSVGYFRAEGEPLTVGQAVKVGDIVGSVLALGHANDVECGLTGEIVEILVEPDQAVMYGQEIARVKVKP